MNWDCYGRCGMEEVAIAPKLTQMISSNEDRQPQLQGIYMDSTLVRVFSRFKVGSPHSKFQFDEDWEEYCQGVNETGVHIEERSSFVPAELSLRALLKQLDRYQNVETAVSTRSDLEEGWLRELIEPYCRGFRILTQHEAIYGVKDEFGTLEPLNMQSSPGEGLNKLSSDKARLFELHWDWVMELLAWDWKAIVIDGFIPMWFFKASEKDERREFVRVIDFKTRLFMAECVIPIITARRLYGDFVRRFVAAGKTMSFFSAAGMEVYYGMWDRFIRYLTANLQVQNLESFDMPKYDKEFPHEWHESNGQIVASMCGDPDMTEPIMRNAARIAYSPALLTITGGVFFRPADNPSGHLCTTVWNCMGIQRLAIRTWLRCDGDATAPSGGTSIARFHRFIRNKIIGDDHIFTISPGSPMTAEHFCQVSREAGWPPEREGTGFLDDSHFAGRASVLAQINGWDIFLPLINTDKILAVNEYRKGKPHKVKQLARAYAACELAFPTLFLEGSSLFAKLYGYFLRLKKKALMSEDVELRAVAMGLPTYERIWTLYTDRPCPVRELSQLVAKQVKCAAEGGTSLVLGYGP